MRNQSDKRGSLGNYHKTSLPAVTTVLKRAIGATLERTNSWFPQSKWLKFTDIVEYQTAQVTFKAKRNVIIWKGKVVFLIRATRKGFCVWVQGRLEQVHQRGEATSKRGTVQRLQGHYFFRCWGATSIVRLLIFVSVYCLHSWYFCLSHSE